MFEPLAHCNIKGNIAVTKMSLFSFAFVLFVGATSFCLTFSATLKPVPIAAVTDMDQPYLDQWSTTQGTGSVMEATEDSLQSIKENMFGGLEQIRNSIIGLIAFFVGGAKQVVEKQVQGVVKAVEKVANETEIIKDSLQSAGGALVQTWGDSFKQTGNITGELIHAVVNNRQMTK